MTVMRSSMRGFTMRKDGVLPGGDWWNIQAKKKDGPAKVYIYDEIGFWGTSAKEFVKALDDLDVDEFELHVNSPGGEIFDGYAIFNAIHDHKAHVTAHVDGLAASAASFIVQAADEIIMSKASEMMIHDGIGFAYGNEADMLATAQILGNLSNEIATIYADRSGKSQVYWRDLMKETLWMNAQEAVDFGLADKVQSKDEEDEDVEEAAKAKNKWDLTLVCNSADRAHAEEPSRVAARVVMLNNQKEKNMGDEPTKEGLPTETGTPTGDPNEPGTTVVPDTEPTTADPEPVTADQPETPAPQPTSQAQGVLINGVMETDLSKIAAYVNTITTAQKDAEEVARTNFVSKLSDENKIPATQIESLTAHALSLTAAQYATFKASYESLPVSSLFDQHATTQDGKNSSGAGLHNAGQMTQDEKKDRILVLQGVVDQLGRTMTSQADVEKTKSYIELQQLLGETNQN